MKVVKALLYRDFKNIFRDYILLFAFIGPLLYSSLLYFGLPIITEYLKVRLTFDLTPYYSLIYVYLILITPLLMGTFMGFIILDEKDDNILPYIAVTELGKTKFLLYRIITPTMVSILITIITVYIVPLADISFLRTMAMVLIASMEAPIVAFFLGGFANNKVEGMALSKGMGILFFAPAVSFFVGSKLKYFAAILPPFWVNEVLLWESYLYPLIFGLLLHLMVLISLVRKFSNSYK